MSTMADRNINIVSADGVSTLLHFGKKADGDEGCIKHGEISVSH